MCWGRNSYGQLGDGTNRGGRAARPVDGLEQVISLATGGSHSCAVKNDGSTWCWGHNNYGQLGDSTTTQRRRPTRVMGLDAMVEVATVNGRQELRPSRRAHTNDC